MGISKRWWHQASYSLSSAEEQEHRLSGLLMCSVPGACSGQNIPPSSWQGMGAGRSTNSWACKTVKWGEGGGKCWVACAQAIQKTTICLQHSWALLPGPSLATPWVYLHTSLGSAHIPNATVANQWVCHPVESKVDQLPEWESETRPGAAGVSCIPTVYVPRAWCNAVSAAVR